MLLYVAVSLIILLLTLSIHYFHHFKFIICKQKFKRFSSADSPTYTENNNNSPTPESIPSHSIKKQCICKLYSKSNESNFNFFPMSFLLYIIFIIFLCILIVIIEVLHNYQNNKSLYRLSIDHKSYHNNYIDEISKLYLNDDDDRNDIIFIIIDYILIYGIMILSIWESLFSFYRYYTTFKTTISFHLVSITMVIKKFMIYPIIFCTVFLIQIHIYYYLFPLIILLHCIFNGYYTIKFASLILEQYKRFSDVIKDENENDDMLNSVRVMKRTSLICCMLQSIYLSLFVVTYNVNTIYYLPIIWSICSGVFSLNFIRNRIYLQSLFICNKRKENKITEPTLSQIHDGHQTEKPSLTLQPTDSNFELALNIFDTFEADQAKSNKDGNTLQMPAVATPSPDISNNDEFVDVYKIDTANNDEKEDEYNKKNIDQVMASLNVLVSYGFYSKKHIKALIEVEKYYNFMRASPDFARGYAHTARSISGQTPRSKIKQTPKSVTMRSPASITKDNRILNNNKNTNKSVFDVFRF